MEWLLPGAVYAALDVAAGSPAGSSEHDRASSSSPLAAFSVKVPVASSLSSPSSSWSSSDDRAPRFSPSRKQSPLLCFGAGGAGRLLWGGARARAPAKQQQEEAAAASMAPPKADPVGRYLWRRISGRLRRRARSGGKVSPSPRGAAAVDDTARETAESVARAIAYCKDTLWRGAPAPSRCLDDWLHDGQEEIIASATAAHGKEPPHHDHDHDAGGECRGESVTAAAAAKSLRSPSDLAAVELEAFCSIDEMEFMKIFDGDDEHEVINHYFISVQI